MMGESAVLWSARILGLCVCLFLALFALDALDAGKPLLGRLVDFAVHLLPAAVVLGVMILSWRRPWIGSLAFVLLAAAYAWMARTRLDWVLAISGPLLAAGLLFAWSWMTRRSGATPAL